MRQHTIWWDSSLQQRHFLKWLRAESCHQQHSQQLSVVGINPAFLEGDFLAHYSIHYYRGTSFFLFILLCLCPLVCGSHNPTWFFSLSFPIVIQLAYTGYSISLILSPSLFSSLSLSFFLLFLLGSLNSYSCGFNFPSSLSFTFGLKLRKTNVPQWGNFTYLIAR